MPIYDVLTSDRRQVGQVAIDAYADIPTALRNIAPGASYRVDEMPLGRTRGAVILDPSAVLLGSAPQLGITPGITSSNNFITIHNTNTTGAGISMPLPAPVIRTVTSQELPAVTNPTPVVTGADPEQNTDNLTYQYQRIGERQWRVQAVKGGSLSRRGSNIIYLEAAPIKSFVPGTTPSLRAINNWRRGTEWVLDKQNRLLVNNLRNVAYIFGKWRPSYAKIIEELLGMVELPVNDGDGIEVLKKALDRAQGSVLKEQKQRMTQTINQIDQYQRYLTDALRNRDSIQRIIDNFKKPEADTAQKMLARLQKVEGVEQISVRKEEIFVLTNHIYIDAARCPRGTDKKTKYDIGKFRIALNIVTGSVQFKNTTRQIQGREHPHVMTPTGACLGEISRNIPEFFSKLMIPELVRTLIIYLASVNVMDPAGATIIYWPVVVDEAPKAGVPPTVGTVDQAIELLNQAGTRLAGSQTLAAMAAR